MAEPTAVRRRRRDRVSSSNSTTARWEASRTGDANWSSDGHADRGPNPVLRWQSNDMSGGSAFVANQPSQVHDGWAVRPGGRTHPGG